MTEQIPIQTDSTSASASPDKKTTTLPDLPPEALDLATRLFDCARAGDTQELTRYFDAGIPVNMRTHDGNSFLMLAAYHGHYVCVKELLNRGADVNLQNDKGQSPLAGVTFKGFFDIAKLLVEEGNADIHAGTPDAMTTAAMFKRNDFLTLFEEVLKKQTRP